MSNGYHYSITWRWHLKILNWSNTSCSCSFSSLISSISSASKSSALPLSALSLSLSSAPKSSALPLSAVVRNAEGEVLRWGFRPVHGLVSPLATELQAIKEGVRLGVLWSCEASGLSRTVQRRLQWWFVKTEANFLAMEDLIWFGDCSFLSFCFIVWF